MTTTRTIRSIAGAAIAAGAMLFVALPGSAHAEGELKSQSNLRQLGLAVHNVHEAGSNTNSVDFFIWQRPPEPGVIR